MILYYLFIFLFGLCVGSFLNVLISRLPREKTIGGRSHCPKCGHILGWRDLVPVLSYILLRGRCRYCKEPISVQYPVVELATGILFIIIFISFPTFVTSDVDIKILTSDVVALIYFLFVVSCLIVIFVSDLKYFIIPDELIIAGIIFVLLFWIFNLGFVSDFGFRISDFKNLLNPFLAGLGASAFFFSIVLLTKGRGMGLGDVKLAFLMGLILGWPNILVALLLAFVFGALVGLGLMIAGRAKMKTELPFGTFLCASTFAVMMFGPVFIKGYWGIFF